MGDAKWLIDLHGNVLLAKGWRGIEPVQGAVCTEQPEVADLYQWCTHPGLEQKRTKGTMEAAGLFSVSFSFHPILFIIFQSKRRYSHRR